MSLDTIKDFDFGVGANIMLTQRVSSSPSDVSKTEVDFIVLLMLEQEFRKVKKRKQQARQQRRTQHDGLHDEDEDDGDEIDRPIIPIEHPVNEKLRIAREYAEKCLRSGIGDDNIMLWEDLSETDREAMLLQLCRNCDLLQGSAPIQSVPDMFARLRTSKFRSKFSVKQPLAKGGFGEVYLVTKDNDPSNTLYAMKKITPYECESLLDDVKAAVNESKILKLLRGHKNIVEIYDYWLEIEPSGDNSFSSSSYSEDDSEEGPLKFYIQLEFCSPSLKEWKESNHKRGVVLEKWQILDMALQIFDGLGHIHKHNVLHLDINPRNILWKDQSYRQLKIVDFGLARKAISHDTKDGTAGYIAPESPLTHKSDVYSAAVTIIEVAKTIYTNFELSEIIRQKTVDTGVPNLDELLCRALDEDPNKRPSAASIVASLSVRRMED